MRRLDRLITDISDASRLDAELAREDAGRVDLKKLRRPTSSTCRADAGRHKEGRSRSSFKAGQAAAGRKGFIVIGHDLRLGQVITNLIENARSFVPEEARPHRVSPVARRQAASSSPSRTTVRASAPTTIERIFERFYTDRPSGEAFGQNSGLGLSISRQIVEAHGGTLTAENIAGAKPGEIRGARFIVTLPADG